MLGSPAKPFMTEAPFRVPSRTMRRKPSMSIDGRPATGRSWSRCRPAHDNDCRPRDSGGTRYRSARPPCRRRSGRACPRHPAPPDPLPAAMPRASDASISSPSRRRRGPKLRDALLRTCVDIFGQQRALPQRRGLGERRGWLRRIRWEMNGEARQEPGPREAYSGGPAA